MNTGSITVCLKTEKSSRSWVVPTWENAVEKADNFKKYKKKFEFQSRTLRRGRHNSRQINGIRRVYV